MDGHATNIKEMESMPGLALTERGTNHSWSVRDNEPCVLAAVLVSSNPVGEAH
ncbi:MAG TPA: hypothetical protein VNZ93_17520 [Pseudorhodoplanes sp.]|nr:hypothetical protein [Pseudorhodoplanes sp.]